jgi:drug/metabolite transporter (DMT)-like permease
MIDDHRLEAGARRQAITMLVVGACVIGLAPILVRLSATGPAAAGFWRLTFSLPLLAVITWRTTGGLGAPTRATWLAGLAFALDLGFWHYGIANTSVGKATILTNLTPLLVTAIAWFVLGERPAPLFLVAVALSVAGAWIMAATRGLGSVGPNPRLGDTLSLITALWYALYFFAVSAARRHEAASRVMLWLSAVAAPLLLIAAFVLGERIRPASSAGWAACAALGVVHVAGQGAIAWALGRLPPATASVTVLVQPVVAALLGWVLFNELFSGWQMAGGAIALTGVVLAQKASRGR